MAKYLNYWVLIAIIASASLIIGLNSTKADNWIPYTPSGDAIHVKWTRNGEVNVTVTMTFPHSGFMVYWGPVFVSNGEAKANVQVVMWTGAAAQVITHKSYTWTLPGDTEVFKLYVNGHLVKVVQLSAISDGLNLNMGFLGLTASAIAVIIVLLLKFVFPVL